MRPDTETGKFCYNETNYINISQSYLLFSVVPVSSRHIWSKWKWANDMNNTEYGTMILLKYHVFNNNIMSN